MFRVTIEEYNNIGTIRALDIIITTEKLQQLLGRYIMKYGAPDTLVSEEGITELEYYKTIGNGFIAAQVCWGKISNDVKQEKLGSKVIDINKNYKPKESAPPPVPEKPNEVRIQALVDSGSFKKAAW
jgi:hypothetical protein